MFDIIGKRNWFFLFSGLILVPGLIFIILTPLTGGQMGLKFSVDYTGGTVWQIQFQNKDASVDEVRAVLVAKGITDAEVSEDSANNITIRTKRADLLPVPTAKPVLTANASQSAAAASAAAVASASALTSAQASATAKVAAASASAAAAAQASAVASALASAGLSPSPVASATATVTATATAGASASPAASASPTVAPNSVDQAGNACELHLPTTGTLASIAVALQADPKLGPIACTGMQSTVGPIVSAQLIQQAILLIILGSIGILAWITWRFWAAGGVKFGVTALAALLHDVIVVVGLFAIMGTLFGVQVDALFVTAMLTVIGFSVHDTIVVYDRIRENKTRHAGEAFDAIVNHSVLQTFGRSINTSLTVVITLTALLLFSGESIHNFVLALLIGIVSGTYSSIFNASPLLVVWQLWEDKRRAQRLAAVRGRRGAY